MSGTRRAVLRTLADAPGDIVDSHGFATAVLLSRPGLDVLRAQAVRRALADLDAAGFVSRDVRGRRVYRIGLTDVGREAAAPIARALTIEDRFRDRSRVAIVM